MASTIIIKNGTGSAVPSSLIQGELAINTDNGTLYYGSGSENSVVNNFSFNETTITGITSSNGIVIADTKNIEGNRMDIRANRLNIVGGKDIEGDIQIKSGSTSIINIDCGGNGGAVVITTPITSSAISSSGIITAAALVGASGQFSNIKVNEVRAGTSGTGVYVNAELTASNHISASGNIYGNVVETPRINGVNDSLYVADAINAQSSITASGDIIANEFIMNTNTNGIKFMASNGTLFNNILTNSSDDFIVQNLKNGENLRLRAGQSGNKGKVLIQQGGTTTNIAEFGPTDSVNITGTITASGNISSSGNITANYITAFNGGLTGSMGRAGTQGWGGNALPNKDEIVTIPYHEFVTDNNSSIRVIAGIYAAGSKFEAARNLNSGIDYFAHYVIPKGYVPVGAMVYASGGTFSIYGNNAMSEDAVGADISSQAVASSQGTLTELTISSSTTPLTTINQVSPRVGDYVTIQYNPSALSDALYGAVLTLRPL